MTQSHPLIKIFSVRGLGYLLQHPLEKKILEPVLMPVINCACHPEKNVAKEAIRTLQFHFRHLDVDTYGPKAVKLIPLLLKYFPGVENVFTQTIRSHQNIPASKNPQIVEFLLRASTQD